MKKSKFINYVVPFVFALLALVLFSWLLKLTYFVSFQVFELSQTGHGALSSHKTLMNLAVDGLLVIAVLVSHKWLNIPSIKNLGFRNNRLSNRIVFVSLGIMIFQYFLVVIGSTAVGTRWSLGSFDMMSLFRAIILMLGVGIGEEVFFRAGIFNILKPLGRKSAYIFGALMFAFAHFFGESFHVLRLLGTLLPGLLFIYIYEQTESIWPGSIIHAMLNLFSLLIIHQVSGVSLTSYSGNENFVAVLWTITYTLTLIAIAYYVKRAKLKQ